MKKTILIATFGIFIFSMFLPVTTFAQSQNLQTSVNTTGSQTDKSLVAVPEPDEKTMNYYNSGIFWWIINMLLGLLIPFLFLQTGASARIRDWAQKVGKKWAFVLIIYFIIFMIITYLIGLPMDFYLDYVRQHEYGLSNQTFGKWLSDSLISLAIALIAGSLLISIPYFLLRRSPRRWWLYTSILLIPFFCLVMLITPIVIDPLFNNFGEMKNKQLETKILQLADRAGIEGSRVYEVDKSADTNAVNAYVTGFMNTKRIVLWDTIISKLNEEELLFVMGHEMGHYVLGHVWKGLIFLSLMTFITLYLAYRILNGLVKKYGSRWGFSELSDPAALPLILLVVGFLSSILSPIALGYSRYAEHEADRFALEITHSNHAGATAFVKLQTENLSNPRPGLVIKLLRASHPPIGERIDFCNAYRPWETGDMQSYENLFKK